MTGIRTPIAAVKIKHANHYTIGPPWRRGGVRRLLLFAECLMFTRDLYIPQQTTNECRNIRFIIDAGDAGQIDKQGYQKTKHKEGIIGNIYYKCIGKLVSSLVSPPQTLHPPPLPELLKHPSPQKSGIFFNSSAPELWRVGLTPCNTRFFISITFISI